MVELLFVVVVEVLNVVEAEVGAVIKGAFVVVVVGVVVVGVVVGGVAVVVVVVVVVGGIGSSHGR